MVCSKGEKALWVKVRSPVKALETVARILVKAGGEFKGIELIEKPDGNYLYLETSLSPEELLKRLEGAEGVEGISLVPTFYSVYGKRVIVIGGGAQVAEVAKGAISEADRHNLRGEKISVDTIPLVGERELAEAVRAVARLPRARILILAGSLMGGEVTEAVKEVKAQGIWVVSLNMAGSVPNFADLVVTDPTQAGVMSVMAIADTAEFDLERQRGRKY